MSPPREDNYLVTVVSNVTATPNISTYAVNTIVNNTLDELLSSDDARTAARNVAVGILFVIYLFLSFFGAFYHPWSNQKMLFAQSRLN